MTDAGPMNDTMEMDAPVKRDSDAVRSAQQAVAISPKTGLLTPTSLAQAIDFSQAMAKAGSAIPKHLRASPGACLAVIEYASNWGLMAYAVANQSYVVSDRLCFMGQLVHSVIKMRVPLRFPKLGLESKYEGEGINRKCIVSAEVWIDDERTISRVMEWPSPIFKDIQPKNSPLWQTDPDQQLFYRTTQRWQRRYFPEILLGVYTKDEMEDMTEEERADLAKDVSPPSTLASRLLGNRETNGDHREGYQPGHVEVLGTAAAGPTGAMSELDMVAAGGTYSHPGAATDPTIDRKAFEAQQEEVLRKAIAARVAKEQQAQDELTEATGEPDPKDATESRPSGADAQDIGAGEPKARKPREKAAPKPEDGPVTDDEYVKHVQKWAAEATTPDQIHERWAEEKKLRSRCGVIGVHFDGAKEIKDARLKELGG